MKTTLRSTRGHAQRGMAMIEVLVSVLLFSLGVLGLIGLQARAITSSIEAEDRNRAALIANEIASAMWLNNTNVISTTAGGANSWDTKVATALPLGKVKVEVEPSIPNSANITLTWSPPQRGTTEQAESRLETRVILPPTP
ncbi:MAG: type IV pilus modification protein PilV [Pseudoxanthomonas sp.]